MLSLIGILDLIGTVAFAISGAALAIRRHMDILGVNVLAIVTATGGGMMRDLIVGDTPPAMFRNPMYVLVSAITANLIFLILYRRHKVPEKLRNVSGALLFWSDSLGLAAFSVDGVTAGIRAGYGDNLFLLTFLGVMTGVGGGVLRDIFANRMPYIFQKHVYALASIIGAALTAVLIRFTHFRVAGMATGFFAVLLVRVLASHYKWNLPTIPEEQQ